MTLLAALAPKFIPEFEPARNGHAVTKKWVNRSEKWTPFYGCVGVVDGVHVKAVVSKKDEVAWLAHYVDRKGGTTMNFAVACDEHCRIIFAAGGPGTANDSGMLTVAAVGDRFPPGFFWLGDAGYGIQQWLIPPYSGTRYHLKEWARAGQRPETMEELFNLRHAQLRNTIERRRQF